MRQLRRKSVDREGSEESLGAGRRGYLRYELHLRLLDRSPARGAVASTPWLARQVSVFTLALQSVTTAVWPEAVAGIEETRRRLRHYAGGSPRNCVWTSASSSGMCRRTTCETMVESNES